MQCTKAKWHVDGLVAHLEPIHEPHLVQLSVNSGQLLTQDGDIAEPAFRIKSPPYLQLLHLLLSLWMIASVAHTLCCNLTEQGMCMKGEQQCTKLAGTNCSN